MQDEFSWYLTAPFSGEILDQGAEKPSPRRRVCGDEEAAPPSLALWRMNVAAVDQEQASFRLFQAVEKTLAILHLKCNIAMYEKAIS